MSYRHLSLEERHYIEVEKKMGASSNEIAKALGRSQTTISREIDRNTGQRGYRHKQASSFAAERHQNKPKSIKLTSDITEQIDVYLKQDWSPEQIAGRLKHDGVVELHHETVYQYVLAGNYSPPTWRSAYPT